MADPKNEPFGNDVESEAPITGVAGGALGPGSPDAESPEAFLARIEKAVSSQPEPVTTFSPQPVSAPVDSVDTDPAVIAHGDVMEKDSGVKITSDTIMSLLPIALRLIRLYQNRQHRGHLDKVLTEIGVPENEYDRPGFVTVPPERQAFYDALSSAI